MECIFTTKVWFRFGTWYFPFCMPWKKCMQHMTVFGIVSKENSGYFQQIFTGIFTLGCIRNREISKDLSIWRSEGEPNPPPHCPKALLALGRQLFLKKKGWFVPVKVTPSRAGRQGPANSWFVPNWTQTQIGCVSEPNFFSKNPIFRTFGHFHQQIWLSRTPPRVGVGVGAGRIQSPQVPPSQRRWSSAGSRPS